MEKKDIKRAVVNIKTIIGYGLDNATIIENALRAENTESKLENIIILLDDWNGTTASNEALLFVIQKLLSYPKHVRQTIADKIKVELEREAEDIVVTKGYNLTGEGLNIEV